MSEITTRVENSTSSRSINSTKLPIYTALITLFTLLGGLAFGIASGSLTHFGLPESMNETMRIGISALPGLGGAFLGGILWGWLVAKLVAPAQTRRMAWAGGLSFGPTFIVVALILTALEVILVQQNGTELPIHIIFTLLFVPAAAVVAASGAFALGIALCDWHLAVKLSVCAGLASGLCFLIVTLLMDNLLGYRVGAPGAAAKATMITVLFVGIITCSLAGGAVVGWLLTKKSLAN